MAEERRQLVTWQLMRCVWPAVQMGALPVGPSFEKSQTVFREPPCIAG